MANVIANVFTASIRRYLNANDKELVSVSQRSIEPGSESLQTTTMEMTDVKDPTFSLREMVPITMLWRPDQCELHLARLEDFTADLAARKVSISRLTPQVGLGNHRGAQ